VTALSQQERDELRDAGRKLLVERSSSTHVRALLDDPLGFDRTLWAQMAELGWLAIHIPEVAGGMGASFADLAVILHELGRQVAMAPVLGSVVLGGSALMAAENDDLAVSLLPDIAGGERIVTVASANAGGSYEPSQLGVRWQPESGGVRLAGMARFVPDAHVADELIVAATDARGDVCVALIDARAAGVEVRPEATYDATRRLCSVQLDVVVDDRRLLGEPGRSADLHERLTAVGAVAVAVDALGAAERMMEISAAYARERIQFGRPIGSFQAVKHHCANMLVAVEASRALVLYAAELFDAPADELSLAAAAVSSFSIPACADACSLAVQVHGGIGFTWEHDAHLFLKRVKLDEALFGRPGWHRRRLGARVLATPGHTVR
jgi:alkylation response protein AidB-like acyl-CoA dehydrogenase